MSDNSMSERVSEEVSESGRQKQKIRIKYRQRVKIKKRPKGYKIKKYWKKNKKNFVAYTILVLLIGATLFMVAQVAKQQMELKRHEKNQKLRLR